MTFKSHWQQLMGEPAPSGSWLIWGKSYQGKTHFALSLAKYLCGFGRVAYNSLEEGVSESIRKTFERLAMQEVNGSLLLLDRESMEELKQRLSRKKSPRFIFIDSLQYAHLTYPMYTELVRTFPTKLFVWISHADGHEPAGSCARKVRYDANVKIHVEGYRAFCDSRYGGDGEPMTIWAAGADKYWVKKV
ncbi:MAG: hypothetical protein GDA51_01830 [Ekhidna sp.]|nr:hypothetical protein [Ekhidna sp.]